MNVPVKKVKQYVGTILFRLVSTIYEHIGKDAPVQNAKSKVLGQTQYCADMQSYRMLYAKLIRSTVAHACITRIDTSAAEAMPGIVAVLTSRNTPAIHYDRGRCMSDTWACDQETIFTDHVRYIGDRIGAVVADTPEAALAACAAVEVEYAPFPAAFTVEQTLQEHPPIHDTHTVYTCHPLIYHENDNKPEGIHISTIAELQRTTHLAMEPHAAKAIYDAGSGCLTVHTPCQSVFGIRSTLNQVFGLPMNLIRVVKTPMGGSFGCKQETILEPIAAACAIAVKGAVLLELTREEVISNTILRHNGTIAVNSIFSPSGKCLSMNLDCTLDAGAYQTVSPFYSETICQKSGKVYAIPNMECKAKSVCTNTSVNGSYRSWGSAESATALEFHMDSAARRLGMDPITLRLMNIHNAGDLNYLTGMPLGNIHFHACLEQGAAAFNWPERRKQAELGKTGRYRLGVGMALGSHTSGAYPGRSDLASVVLKMQEDGSLIATVCYHDHGCGTGTALKKIAAETLRMEEERISFEEGDTNVSLHDYGCYASRTIYVTGRAVQLAALRMMDKVKSMAALLLEVDSNELEYKDGKVFVTAAPERFVTYGQASMYALRHMEQSLTVVVDYAAHANPGVPAAHFAQVLVDTYTGLVKVEKYLAIHDIGKAINPAMCRAQIGGAVQNGIGIALYEEVRIHPKTGRLLTTGLSRYNWINAMDMPKIEVMLIEENEPGGPFGAKSIGEAALVPVVPAIVNAVNHALHTSLCRLPLNPMRILSALSED